MPLLFNLKISTEILETSSPSVPPTAKSFGKVAIDQIDNAAVKLHTQPWTIVAVLIGVSIVLIGICVCCIRRCCRKRRGKDGKKGIKGVDLKSVQLLGSAYKEKVRVTSI